jgi:hypothetical protein
LRMLLLGIVFFAIVVAGALFVQANLTHTASREMDVILYAPVRDGPGATRYYDHAAKALDENLRARGMVPATQPASWYGAEHLYEHTVVRNTWYVMHAGKQDIFLRVYQETPDHGLEIALWFSGKGYRRQLEQAEADQKALASSLAAWRQQYKSDHPSAEPY